MSKITFPFTLNGEPFFPVGGQTHNSSGFCLAEMERAWKALKAIDANSFAVPVYWSQVEPVEGEFDFSVIDSIINAARERDLRIAILWFASWKNGKSRYTPGWVKRNPERFIRTVRSDGEPMMVLSPHCQDSLDADRKAFEAFMGWLKEKDSNVGTVYTVQIENEPGLLSSDRDYSPLGNAAYAENVPDALLDAMRANPESNVSKVWQFHGQPVGANWETSFGWDGAEFCTALAFAQYIDALAAAGKAVYNLPLYVNVWMGEGGYKTAGVYPSGGAVSQALDIWKWCAPNIDLIAPDIYLPDEASYLGMCNAYAREDNPLYIPECSRAGSNAWWMFEAVGTYRGIGQHIFGVEDMVDDEGNVVDSARETAESLRCLRAISPLLVRYAGTDKVHAIAQREMQSDHLLDLGKWWGLIQFDGGRFGAPQHGRDYHHGRSGNPSQRGRGLLIQTDEDEFYLTGAGYRVLFMPKMSPRRQLSALYANTAFMTRLVNYECIQEGHLDESGALTVDRERNGDESSFGVWMAPDLGVVRVVMVE